MRLDTISPGTWIAIGLGIRMAMLGWGTYQDTHAEVPYTDIDYQVFTSAASHLYDDCPLHLIVKQSPEEEFSRMLDPPVAPGRCAQGIIPATARLMLQMEGNIYPIPERSDPTDSSLASLVEYVVPRIYAFTRPIFRLVAGLGNPYRRDTYRYTPLLAVLLAPAEALAANGYWPDQVQALFGKLLFVLADVLVALLLWDIMDIRSKAQSTEAAAASRRYRYLVGLLWLANPFAAQISTRGSSESVLGVLVLAFVDVLVRAYPERYLPTVSARPQGATTKSAVAGYLPDPALFSNERVLAPLLFALCIHWKLYPIIYAAALIPHLINAGSFRTVVQFGTLSVYCLVCLTAFVFGVWGEPFLQETLLYHVRRADHRHNFSPFFLPAYLTSAMPDATAPLLAILQRHQAILAFVPQLLATGYLGLTIGGTDLVAAMTFQTMAFVALNKVCTSQYYMWFLWFLPLLGPHLHFAGGQREAWTLVAVWVGGQALWLSQAYLLEFAGLDTYVRTWLASLVMLAVHTFLLVRLVEAWSKARLLAQARVEKANGQQTVKEVKKVEKVTK